ncbi:MAG: hypothetical protein JO022_22320, partial [Acidobacteriaceae bacterium]|nr:hypothetical protein [Acidobacteriaceae bacterium]
VRVQTGRLRSKLAEYYAGPGADDALVIEIPKGSYAIAHHPRARVLNHAIAPPAADPPPAAPLSAPALPVQTVQTVLESRSKRLLLPLTVLSTVLAIAVLLLVVTLIREVSSPLAIASTHAAKPDPALSLFWSGFTDNQEYPWAVFSNAEFVGRPETGIRYFDAATDSRSAILDHYSGVGEVIAVHELDGLFAGLGHGLLVKRARLLSLDDAKNHDLIFLGSPSENLPLREIPTAREFVFRRMDLPGHKNALTITNVHPRANEPKFFAGSQTIPLTEDYSVVALVPGMNPTRLVLLLAGISTLGTQAAVEYVCRPDSVHQLLQQLPGFKESKPVPFEALLKVEVKQGVPVFEQLVALRLR